MILADIRRDVKLAGISGACLILEGSVLASYGWYSRAATQISEELVLRFNPEWVYMYKGFTRPECRGLRLHAIGMAIVTLKLLGRYIIRVGRGCKAYGLAVHPVGPAPKPD